MDRAFRLTAEIADHAQWAKTQVAVACELFASNPDQASSLVDEVLQQSGTFSDDDRSTIFRHIASFLPERLVSHLESAGNRENLIALVDDYFELYDGNAILFKLQRLARPWLERLCETIRRVLSTGNSPPLSALRLLLLLLEHDPDREEDALSQGFRGDPEDGKVLAVAEAIVQARRDLRASPARMLQPETIDSTFDRLLSPKIRGSETMLLLTQIVVPNQGQFIEALRGLEPSWESMNLRLDFARVLLQQTGNIESAVALLHDACRLCRPLAEQTGYEDFKDGSLVDKITKALTRRSLQQADAFRQELKNAG